MRERWRMATTMWQRTDRTKEKGRRVDVVFEWLFFLWRCSVVRGGKGVVFGERNGELEIVVVVVIGDGDVTISDGVWRSELR
ncbi:hypothetical protein HanRHA438_Chr05g0230061 [Helianthus annuus]|nr:hypothetical protein HanRHA438_Chr05g0230061 [Helianthus annuus]